MIYLLNILPVFACSIFYISSAIMLVKIANNGYYKAPFTRTIKVTGFFVPFKNGFNADLWYCLHLISKRSKEPLMKTVTLTVRVNKALQPFASPTLLLRDQYKQTSQ